MSPTDALAALRSEATKLQERYVDDEYDARSAWRLVTDCYKWMNDALALAATLVEERDSLRTIASELAEAARAPHMSKPGTARDIRELRQEHARLDAENRRLRERLLAAKDANGSTFCTGEFPCEASTFAASFERERNDLAAENATLRAELEAAENDKRGMDEHHRRTLAGHAKELEKLRAETAGLVRRTDVVAVAQSVVRDYESIATDNARGRVAGAKQVIVRLRDVDAPFPREAGDGGTGT